MAVNGLNNILCLLFIFPSLFSIAFVFLLIYTKRGIFHTNVRLLLLNFYIANCFSSLFLIVQIGYNFLLLYFGFDFVRMKQSYCNLFDSGHYCCNIAATMFI